MATPVFLPRVSCVQRSLVGCSPQGRTESDTTEATQHACMHWRRKWQPTPVFLPGESQGQRSLVGCRLWDRTESDTTEAAQQQQHNIWVSSISFSKISFSIVVQISVLFPFYSLSFGLSLNFVITFFSYLVIKDSKKPKVQNFGQLKLSYQCPQAQQKQTQILSGGIPFHQAKRVSQIEFRGILVLQSEIIKYTRKQG